MRATGSWHGDVDTGKASVWGNEIYNPERLEFFDRHLKGITVPEDDPPVRLYVLGTGDRRVILTVVAVRRLARISAVVVQG